MHFARGQRGDSMDGEQGIQLWKIPFEAMYHTNLYITVLAVFEHAFRRLFTP
jgi:hypothetical protein